MSEKKIANFLKQLRKTSGCSANEVVEKLKLYNIDISAKTLYGYESGLSMPNADAFISLCRIYKCENPMDIFGGFSLKPDEISLIEKYRALDQHGQETVDIILDRETARVNALSELERRQITVIDFDGQPDVPARFIQYYQRVSAGTGELIYEDITPERIAIPDIPKYRRVAYAVEVSGQSMEPLYYDGDMLLIEPTCIVDIGEIGIFNVDGKAFVKKRGVDELISLNKQHENITLTNEARCMGRVVDKLVI